MIVKAKAFANLREVFGGEMNVNLKEGAILKDLLSPFYLPSKVVEVIIDNKSGNIKPLILILKNGRISGFWEVFLLNWKMVTK